MSKFLAGIAALTLAGAAVMPIQASATEREAGASTTSTIQSTEFSAQRRYGATLPVRLSLLWPRAATGVRAVLLGAALRLLWLSVSLLRLPYRPGIALGVGPFGFRVF